MQVTVKKGDKNVEHHINWPQEPINKHIYVYFKKLFAGSTNYATPSASDIKALETALRKQNTRHGCDVEMSQVLSIRNAVVKQKIISRHSLMNSQISKIAAEYASGTCILALSKRFDFPPLNLLRGIFLHRGANNGDMWNLFAQREPATKYLSGRDLVQYGIANSNDAENAINQKQANKIALDNEDKFVGYLASCNIKLKTQADLTREQTTAHGRATSTPDVLFLDTVYINGTRIHWIDFKDYVGTSIRFLANSNCEQADKYNKLWGNGALCYSKGFVDIKCPNTLILSGKDICSLFV